MKLVEVSMSPSIRAHLRNAVIAEVDFDAGNFTGLPTNQELARISVSRKGFNVRIYV
jgi:hypothetical protein